MYQLSKIQLFIILHKNKGMLIQICFIFHLESQIAGDHLVERFTQTRANVTVRSGCSALFPLNFWNFPLNFPSVFKAAYSTTSLGYQFQYMVHPTLQIVFVTVALNKEGCRTCFMVQKERIDPDLFQHPFQHPSLSPAGQ